MSEDRPQGTEVPAAALDADVLRALVEEFVTRDGTDYGAQEVPLTAKVEAVMGQLASGEVRILFDPDSASVTLRNASDLD